ncbi:MAG: 16S rRNA (cytidine1402-2'-O)-methyltransferase [Polaribacter sp.]|jgi:16S rRNA (cytidine1402-2'-O)-methyltransferase
MKGKLYLIPTPLGEGATHVIPPYVIEQMHKLNYIIAERGKTVRAFMKSTNPVKPFNEIKFFELNKFTDKHDLPSFVKPLEEGHDVGLLSEAGCPGVADPGAVIVRMAHRKGIEVVPFVGPSSILLALMGSGMNGQSFCFHGYIPQKKPAISKTLSKLEQMAIRHKQAQIFIETPYRNNPLFQEAIKELAPTTKFCVATNLTLESQSVVTKTIAEWKKNELPDLHKKPTVFLIGH